MSGVEPTERRVRLEVASTWDGDALEEAERVRITLGWDGEGLAIELESPFYGDPTPPRGPGSFPLLWEYEVVEVLIAGPDDQYTEVELGPHGHYLMLCLDGVRQVKSHGHELVYVTARRVATWRGVVRIGAEYLPPPPWRVGAFAIHGKGADRRYLSAFPATEPGEFPDFHRLDAFEALDAEWGEPLA